MKKAVLPLNSYAAFVASNIVSLFITAFLSILAQLFLPKIVCTALYLSFILIFIILFTKLNLYPLTSFLQLSACDNKTYRINMRIFSYITHIRKENLKPYQVLSRYRSEFKEAIEKSTNRVNDYEKIFSVTTWLFANNDRSFLESIGFLIKPSSYSLKIEFERFILICISRIAFDKVYFPKVKANLKTALFYEIRWNKEQAEELIKQKTETQCHKKE